LSKLFINKPLLISSSTVQIKKWPIVAILSTIIFAGVIIRLYDLTNRTMTHIEIYTPGIDLPANLSIPAPRFTLREILIDTIVTEDPNPPGYCILMLGWTKLFGNSLLVLRLPSMLFGLACIPLIYFLGVLEKDRIIGLLAAAMLAFNGYHVFWSQFSKPYSLACFLGLLSTILLILALKTGRRQFSIHFAYLVVTIVGLATSIWFWPFFIAQTLWVLMGKLSNPKMPGLLGFQFAIYILGSPLIALAFFQARRESYVNPDILQGLINFFQFGNLFEPDFFSAQPYPLPLAVTVLLIIIALLLLGYGLFVQKEHKKEEGAITPGLPRIIIIGVCLFAFLFILRFAQLMDWNKRILASSIAPIIFLTSYLLIQKYWQDSYNFRITLYKKIPTFFINFSLPSFLAVVPIGMVAVVSIFIPLLASRGVMLFTPYLTIVLANGLYILAHRTRLWIFIVVVLTVLYPLSIGYYKHGHHESPNDYKTLATQWIPRINDSDLIFIQKHWVTTPIFYYLQWEHFSYIGENYFEELRNHPNVRVWVLTFPGLPISPEEETALKDYHIQDTIEALRIGAVLYVRNESIQNQP
jgi:uncharacterized membrane protein